MAAVSLYTALSLYRSEDQSQNLMSCRQGSQVVWSATMAKNTGYKEEDI